MGGDGARATGTAPGLLTHEELLRLTPFAATVGVRFDRLDAHEVTAHLPWAPHLCTVGGVLHGGALVSLGDAAAGVCAHLNLPRDAAGTTTIELSVHFLHGVRAGVVTATARPLHVGPTVTVIRTDLHDDTGVLVGQLTQSQATLR